MEQHDIERRLTALEVTVNGMQKQMDENDRVTTGIHKLAANMENLTAEVKRLAEKLENGLREQGKRIGDTETKLVLLTNIDGNVKDIESRLDTLEKEPGQKWKSLTAQIIGIVVTAVVTGLIVKLT